MRKQEEYAPFYIMLSNDTEDHLTVEHFSVPRTSLSAVDFVRAPAFVSEALERGGPA